MTSSETSTEKALAPRNPEERLVLGLRPAMLRAILVVGFVWVPAIAVVLGMYGTSPTLGALFYGLGWLAFAGSAWYIVRAALAFDVSPADTLALEDNIDEERRAELQSEKKVLLKAIKEIEFDHQMGKLDDRDAAEITATYRARALEIMRLLDENKSTDYGAVVEKELAKRLAKAGVGSGAAAKKQLGSGDAADALPAAVLQPEVELPGASVAGKCPECGTRNDTDAVFCKKCASRLGS